ncbi:MAG TPA: hypothetical protein P5345_01445 [Candidatus Paceibacterota bacterium]|nr:hypothetical protein [Candidatus Paceibacterota bacterium]HRU33693.1 hypothetical protein [Candidatus Paceibacterota bacterium]
MDDIKKIINKKLNQLGIRQKINEMSVVNYTSEFLKENLPQVNVEEINFFNRNLTIKTQNALEANELKFFEEELKFFLAQKGFKVNKIRIIF